MSSTTWLQPCTSQNHPHMHNYCITFVPCITCWQLKHISWGLHEETTHIHVWQNFPRDYPHCSSSGVTSAAECLKIVWWALRTDSGSNSFLRAGSLMSLSPTLMRYWETARCFTEISWPQMLMSKFTRRSQTMRRYTLLQCIYYVYYV